MQLRTVMTVTAPLENLYSKQMKNLSIGMRRATVLVMAGTWLCGIAAADTIVATGVNASIGEYNVWINENGTDQDSYFAGVINIQLTDAEGNQFNRDTMCVQLLPSASVSWILI